MSKKGYLIDTDIIIDYFKAKYKLNDKIKSVGLDNCYVSEITIAELLFGALKSNDKERHEKNIDRLKSRVQVIPISKVLSRYSKERLRLERMGKRLPDFDLLIAVTAVEYDLTLVTGNVKHHSRVKGVEVENWREKVHNEFIE